MSPRKLNKNKDVLDFSASDLAQEWCDVFREKNKENYKLISSDIGKMSYLSDLYGNYEVLLAIERSVNNGDSSISYFSDKIHKYLTNSDYVKYHCLIERCHSKPMKFLLLELYVLEARMIPTAESQSRIDEIIGIFDEFIAK